MQTLILLLTSLARLISAIPFTPKTPTLSTAHAFTLLIHVPSLDLTPSISHATLSPTHIGAGQNILFLTPLNSSSAPSPQTPLILNTTTSSIYVPLPQFPLGWVVPGLPGDHIVFLNIGTGTSGIGFMKRDGYPKLTGPGTEEGTYVACPHDVPFPPGEEVVAKFLFEGEVWQEGCVGIEFLPVCASKGEGTKGAEVDCFVDGEGF